MVVYTSGLWLDATVALSAAIICLLLLRFSDFKKREIVFLAIALLAGALLFEYEQISGWIVLALEIGILTFNGLLNGRSPKWRTYYISTSVLYLTLLRWIGFVFLAQSMLIGLLSSITNIKEYKSKIEDRAVEVNRDIVHIAMGVILIGIFYFETIPVAISILMILILGGILAISVGEIFKRSDLHKTMSMLERRGTSLGHGALWLALGSLLAVSFLNTTNVLVVFAAIFIGDPVATIVGIYVGGKRLPYNSKKSFAGTLAYFIATTAVASLFIGILYGAVIGAVGAIVESIKMKVDDNFTVSLALVLFILLKL